LQEKPNISRVIFSRKLQELIRRLDSERSLLYDDIAHVLQNTKKRTYYVKQIRR